MLPQLAYRLPHFATKRLPKRPRVFHHTPHPQRGRGMHIPRVVQQPLLVILAAPPIRIRHKEQLLLGKHLQPRQPPSPLRPIPPLSLPRLIRDAQPSRIRKILRQCIRPVHLEIPRRIPSIRHHRKAIVLPDETLRPPVILDLCLVPPPVYLVPCRIVLPPVCIETM